MRVRTAGKDAKASDPGTGHAKEAASHLSKGLSVSVSSRGVLYCLLHSHLHSAVLFVSEWKTSSHSSPRDLCPQEKAL